MVYSIDLRERVIRSINEGMHPTKAVKIFKVSLSTIYQWKNLFRETSSLASKTGYQKGHSHSIKEWELFENFAHKNAKCTCAQMIEKWQEITGKKVHESSILRALHKIGFTFKKNI